MLRFWTWLLSRTLIRLLVLKLLIKFLSKNRYGVDLSLTPLQQIYPSFPSIYFDKSLSYISLFDLFLYYLVRYFHLISQEFPCYTIESHLLQKISLQIFPFYFQIFRSFLISRSIYASILVLCSNSGYSASFCPIYDSILALWPSDAIFLNFSVLGWLVVFSS